MSVKILTVDDSKTIRMIMAKAFKPFDCAVLEAANGADGLAVASREKPDLILLDYTMPIMDGFEVLTRLRADPVMKAMPVIMLTAEAGRETVIKIAKLGVRDYIIKPFKEELLLERVNRVVTLSAKPEAPGKAKRFDDPIKLLVLDDKAAIVDQIRAGLSNTPWVIESTDQPARALELCKGNQIDLVVASLSLPSEGAFAFFDSLRGAGLNTKIPVFGLCVKTAAAEQAKAQQAGFTGFVNKPIDAHDLQDKVCRALKLETSYRYYVQRDGALVLKVPKECNSMVVSALATPLNDRLAETVDNGGNKLIIDLNEVEKATLPVIELVLAAIQGCKNLSLKYSVVCTEALRTECNNYEESQTWPFASTFEDAVALLA